jgi:hypothetical protein
VRSVVVLVEVLEVVVAVAVAAQKCFVSGFGSLFCSKID